ncbi:MAG: hypothetical protein GY812_00080 [Actinomycetia bacterium]|nr:hypothetical protein [Actinomycetes bacterium]
MSSSEDDFTDPGDGPAPDPQDRVDAPPPPDPPEVPAHEPDPGHPLRSAGQTLAEAALEAEIATGRQEETLEEARAGAIRRTIRAVGGFVVIGLGIALLPLPGPGWLVIIFGLSLLPFAWAERTILAIRRRIPGIPEDGKIPLSTWIVMGVLVVSASVVAILFGGAIGNWLGDVWTSIWE